MPNNIEKKLNYDYLIVEDKNCKYFGGDQEWYNSFWKRMAGCGPTTASTITMYEERSKVNSSNTYTKLQFIDLMNKLWKYVTPTQMGVNSTEIYIDGYDRYIYDNKINLLESKCMNISSLKLERPTKLKLLEFLSEAIENNHPVAFLNLDNGKLTNLESWHWVTIVGVSYNQENEELHADIADEGVIKDINLGLWLDTTSKNGGFIYYK